MSPAVTLLWPRPDLEIRVLELIVSSPPDHLLCLCRHLGASDWITRMGGLVIADLMLSLRKSGQSTPWPRILGLVAYDTPYFGLNPVIFKVSLLPGRMTTDG